MPTFAEISEANGWRRGRPRGRFGLASGDLRAGARCRFRSLVGQHPRLPGPTGGRAGGRKGGKWLGKVDVVVVVVTAWAGFRREGGAWLSLQDPGIDCVCLRGRPRGFPPAFLMAAATNMVRGWQTRGVPRSIFGTEIPTSGGAAGTSRKEREGGREGPGACARPSPLTFSFIFSFLPTLGSRLGGT